jgi:hypothetical protein
MAFVRAIVSFVLMVTPLYGAQAKDQSTPPSDVATFAYEPAEGPTGTVIHISGTCLQFGSAPGTSAVVQLARYAPLGDPGPPFDVFVTIPVSSDGTVAGELKVPDNAPVDEYRLQATCFEDDAGFGTAVDVWHVVAPTASSAAVSPTSIGSRAGRHEASGKMVAIILTIVATGLFGGIAWLRKRRRGPAISGTPK